MSKEKELLWVKNPYGSTKENGREPFLEVYTSAELKPLTGEYCNWHFQIISEDFSIVNRQSGFVKLCECEECHLFGSDVFEYFSICEALRGVKKNMSRVPVDLWLDSNKFLNDLENKKFGQPGRYRCPFLRTLDNDLLRVIS